MVSERGVEAKKEISVIGASVVRVRVRYENNSKNSQTIPRVTLPYLLFVPVVFFSAF